MRRFFVAMASPGLAANAGRCCSHAGTVAAVSVPRPGVCTKSAIPRHGRYQLKDAPVMLQQTMSLLDSSRQRDVLREKAAGRSAAKELGNASAPTVAPAWGAALLGREEPDSETRKPPSSMPTYIHRYVIILPFMASLFITFEAIHLNFACIDTSENIDFQGTEELEDSRKLFDGFLELSRGFFWDGPSRSVACILLSVLLVLVLFDLYMKWCFNIWSGEFWDSIDAKNVKHFWRAMLCFVLLAVTQILVSTYTQYLQAMLSIRWRAVLTRQMQELWLLGRGFPLSSAVRSTDGSRRHSPLDNPDQRLQDDGASFTQDSVPLFLGLLSAVGSLVVFVPWLYHLSPPSPFGFAFRIPGWLLYVVVVYSVVGSVLTHTIGRRLMPISFARQRSEANFRHAAMLVRDHADSIALLGAQGAEDVRLTRLFGTVQRVFWESMWASKRLNFFVNMYLQTGNVFPICCLIGNYFQGEITLGGMMQVISAVEHVKAATDFFLEEYTSFVVLRATAGRLSGFFRGMRRAAKEAVGAAVARGPQLSANTELVLKVEGLCVQVPSPDSKGRAIWEDARLEVQAGERVLLHGPDGCGKTSFLRAIAGCYPARGRVQMGPAGALFMPQRLFQPAGTLKEAVTYPDAPTLFSDVQVREALAVVGLEHVTKNMPLHDVVDWATCLSGGEQQRLAFAHVVLLCPELLVLDETTASLGDQGTAELYALLDQRLPRTAVLSIGHDPQGTLASLHTRRLAYDAEAKRWNPS